MSSCLLSPPLRRGRSTTASRRALVVRGMEEVRDGSLDCCTSGSMPICLSPAPCNRPILNAPVRRAMIPPGRTGAFNISVRVHQTASYHNAMPHASCRNPIGGGCVCNKTAEAVHRTLHGKHSRLCQRRHDSNGTKANTSHSQTQTADHWFSTCRACRMPGELSKKKRSPPGCVTSMVLFGVGVCGGQQRGWRGASLGTVWGSVSYEKTRYPRCAASCANACSLKNMPLSVTEMRARLERMAGARSNWSLEGSCRCRAGRWLVTIKKDPGDRRV
ncbi:hypothetical protein EDB80DRAFT_143859 [Ilyonectria destructans]|nr:hypothetical protein EDB80DRAFT_143859 [Ilyonectria destructans]